MNYSLIIPVYNEASVINGTLRELTSAFGKICHGKTWEIIVVDNASTDRTSQIVEAFGDEHVSLIRLSAKGKGNAVREGFTHAKGEIVGFTDADLSIPAEQVVQTFNQIDSQNENILIGSRFHPKSIMPGREWWRIGSSQLFNSYARLMLSVPFRDTQCPLKVVDQEGRALMLATHERTWFFDLEFLTLAHRAGFRVREVPITWNEHYYPERKSKLSTTRDGLRYLLALPRIKQRLPKQLSLWNEKNNNTV